MADDDAPADGEASAEAEDGAKKKGGKGKLIIVLVLVLGIAGGAYFFLGSSDESAALPPCKEEVDPLAPTTSTAPPPKGEKTTTTKAVCAPKPIPAKGSVVQADPITLSLKDGSLLKVGIAVQFGAAAGTGEALKAENAQAAAVDAAQYVLASKTAEELAPGAPRDQAKKEISERARNSYEEGEVLGVYFTSDFVLEPAG